MTGMPALTLWQPWASLIALEVKKIETRSWPAPAKLIGQRIAIHAAQRRGQDWRGGPWSYQAASRCLWELENDRLGRCLYLHGTLGVVATARLAACLPMVEREWVPEGFVGTREDVLAVLPPGHPCAPEIHLWTGGRFDRDVSDQLPYGHFEPGRWAWLLEDVDQLPEPMPATGRQRVWRWSP